MIIGESENQCDPNADIDIPFFRPHNPAVSSTSIIKNGKESATTRTSTKPKTLKPISTIARNKPTFPLPNRSKSEQPPIKKSHANKELHTLPFSRTPANASASSSRAASVQPLLTSRASTPSHNLKPKLDEFLVCPICSRELQTDNAGLNEHIDYCLSRGAIKEASAAAVSTMTVKY